MLTPALLFAALVGPQSPEGLFHPPVRVQVAGADLKVEAPGYAAPCRHDVDGDGRRDLVVGQFAGGRIQVFRARADGALERGEWLRAGGDVAEVPGVW